MPLLQGETITQGTQGHKLSLYTQTLNQNGGILYGRLLTWRSTRPTIATVDTSGRVTGLAWGTDTIWARSWADSAFVVDEIVPAAAGPPPAGDFYVVADEYHDSFCYPGNPGACTHWFSVHLTDYGRKLAGISRGRNGGEDPIDLREFTLDRVQ